MKEPLDSEDQKVLLPTLREGSPPHAAGLPGMEPKGASRVWRYEKGVKIGLGITARLRW